MEKQHYYLKLIPPRPTFPHDMTDDERRLMQEHVAYMRAHFDAGRLLIYGPVLGAEPFGMGVFECANEQEAHEIMENDPTVKAGLNRYSVSPMRVGAARGI